MAQMMEQLKEKEERIAELASAHSLPQQDELLASAIEDIKSV